MKQTAKRKDKNFVLLTPNAKGTKYACELRENVRLTNAGDVKGVGLSNTKKAWRSGYLAAQKDSAKAFRSKHPNYVRKTKN